MQLTQPIHFNDANNNELLQDYRKPLPDPVAQPPVRIEIAPGPEQIAAPPLQVPQPLVPAQAPLRHVVLPELLLPRRPKNKSLLWTVLVVRLRKVAFGRKLKKRTQAQEAHGYT